MRDLPVPDPGTPDCRSASHYIWWIIRRQRRTVIFGIVAGVVWMLAQALMPYATGMAIGAGIAQRDSERAEQLQAKLQQGDDWEAVSYTHLTLPTIYSV